MKQQIDVIIGEYMKANDITKYLTDNYGLLPKVSLNVISALQSSHISNYSFSSISVLLVEELPLDSDSLFDKIVTRNRGGYCFEHNKLFHDVLKEIGYKCKIQLARVLLNSDKDVPRTHRVTKVTLKERDYLVDVGFGPYCPRAPLPLDTEEPQDHGDAIYRIVEPSAGKYLLQMDKEGEWFTLYSFDDGDYTEADCLCGHHYSATFPDAVFVNNLVVSRKMETEIRSIRNESYHKMINGEVEITPIDSEETLNRLLTEEFNILLKEDKIQTLYSKFCISLK